MKRREFTSLLEKSTEELSGQVVKLAKELAQYRHQKRVGRLANPRLVSSIADDIARIKAVIRQRALETPKA